MALKDWLHPATPWSGAFVKILSAAARGAEGPILDVGCGSKPYGCFFPGAEHIGVDLPAPVAGMSAADANASAEKLPFKSGVFNTVLCTQVIAHLKNPRAFFDEAFRVLRPGGTLLLSARHVHGLNEVPRDFFRYSLFGLKMLAEEAGFSVERIEPTGGLWMTAGFMIGYRLWAIGLAFPRPLRILWNALTVAPLNLITMLLDKIDLKTSWCLGYVMRARKGEGKLP